jgi:hypothetical protein
MEKNPIDFEEMIAKADELMYRDKKKRYIAILLPDS